MGQASDDIIGKRSPPEATHEIIDSKTGFRVGTYSSRSRASNAADKKDNDYGAVRYVVRPIK